jgi:phosphate transport system substrate-binding protein
MSPRLARLLSASLISLCASAAVLAAGGQSLIWRGDLTTARGVVTDVAKAWEKSGKGTIELQPFNTASGIDAVAKGTADIAGSARPGLGGAESVLTFTPVAWDGLVMITSPSNPVSNISLMQLHEIYYGHITNWKDLGGKDEPINLYAVASPGDGVEYSMRRLLFGRGNQPVAAPRLYVNVSKLEEGVTLDTKGLGATTLANVANNKKVKILSIDGVAPSTGSISSGSYPLYIELYLVTNATSPKAADVKEFLDFAVSAQANALIRSHGLVPYADGASLASGDAARRARIASTVGTRANVGAAMTTAPQVAAAEAPAAAAQVLATRAKPLTKAEALAKAKADKAAAIANGTAPAPSVFADVVGSTVTTGHAGFVGIQGEAISVSDQAARGGKFAKVTGDAIVVRGKQTAKPLAAATEDSSPANVNEKPSQKIEIAAKPAAKPTAEPAKVAKAPAKATKDVAKAKAPAGRSYTVAQGDTLYSIAKKHSVEVSRLRSINGLKNDNVRLGQVLQVGSPQ